jgi:hypothetical protein
LISLYLLFLLINDISLPSRFDFDRHFATGNRIDNFICSVIPATPRCGLVELGVCFVLV